MIEEWKNITGYEGLYQVSNLGRVKSLNYKGNGTEWILKGYVKKDGYEVVTLMKDGIRKYCRVHRLVALAFLPNPDNLPQINHKDEDKLNNCADNLEWCTGSYNTKYSSYKWSGANNGMNKPGVRERQLQAVRTPEHRNKLREWSIAHNAIEHLRKGGDA